MSLVVVPEDFPGVRIDHHRLHGGRSHVQTDDQFPLVHAATAISLTRPAGLTLESLTLPSVHRVHEAAGLAKRYFWLGDRRRVLTDLAGARRSGARGEVVEGRG